MNYDFFLINNFINELVFNNKSINIINNNNFLAVSLWATLSFLPASGFRLPVSLQRFRPHNSAQQWHICTHCRTNDHHHIQRHLRRRLLFVRDVVDAKQQQQQQQQHQSAVRVVASTLAAGRRWWRHRWWRHRWWRHRSPEKSAPRA